MATDPAAALDALLTDDRLFPAPAAPTAGQRAATEQAIDHVEQAADRGFIAAALAAVALTARRHPDGFTSEDCRRTLAASWPDVHEPAEPRVWGAVMRRAQRDGIIHPTDDYRPVANAKSHTRPARIWRPTA